MAIKMGTPKPAAQDANLTINNASYSGTSFNITSQESNVLGLAFNNTGTRMFVCGTGSGSAVYQYNLTTGFDISTASYSGNSLDVSTENSAVNGLVFNSSGTRMFTTGNSGNIVYQYNLSTGYDLSTASYSTNSLSVGSQDNAPQDVNFNSAGTKMFIVGSQTNNVYEYTLTTGFDLSTASYASISFNVGSQVSKSTDVVFNSLGTRMFVSDNNSSEVYQYNLTTGFDISTASYASVFFDLTGQTSDLTSIDFDANGTKMFACGKDNDAVYEYTL
jgi:WD40 repeat protein